MVAAGKPLFQLIMPGSPEQFVERMWPLLGEVVAMPRPYPPEFRQRALDLVRSGRSVPEVAGLLGIAQPCPYRWKQQDLIDRRLEAATAAVAEVVPPIKVHEGILR
jgi:transposase-like protein